MGFFHESQGVGTKLQNACSNSRGYFLVGLSAFLGAPAALAVTGEVVRRLQHVVVLPHEEIVAKLLQVHFWENLMWWFSCCRGSLFLSSPSKVCGIKPMGCMQLLLSEHSNRSISQERFSEFSYPHPTLSEKTFVIVPTCVLFGSVLTVR